MAAQLFIKDYEVIIILIVLQFYQNVIAKFITRNGKIIKSILRQNCLLEKTNAV